MTEDQIYTPEVIQENPYPGQENVVVPVVSDSVNKTTQTFGASKIPNQSFPLPKVATELISTKLNTKTRKILAEFSFTPSGALQIGDYQNGDAGDIRISPSGIVARNTTGDTTFSLDGESGDAIFAGTIETGTLIAGVVSVGDGNIQIDGDARRMLFYAEDGLPSIVIGTIS